MNRLLLLALTAGLLSSCANRQYGSRWEAKTACMDWLYSGPKEAYFDEFHKTEFYDFERECREDKETKRFIGTTFDKNHTYGRVVRRFLY